MAHWTRTKLEARRDLVPVIVEREHAVMPAGFDTWGVKSVHADLKTYHGYQWPYPGQLAEATDVNEANTGPCPSRTGDGLCVATTWAAMASGGIPARTLLLVATAQVDLLGAAEAEGKARYRAVSVVAVVDGERLLREAGDGANLRAANLRGANLRGANLRGANLREADLYGADLYGADLRGADLYEADLYGVNLHKADLTGVNLRGADLRGADLYEADLYGADLYGVNLYGVNLYGVNLRGINLYGADLYGVNLREADLREADLRGVRADQDTIWPEGFDAAAHGVVMSA